MVLYSIVAEITEMLVNNLKLVSRIEPKKWNWKATIPSVNIAITKTLAFCSESLEDSLLKMNALYWN